MRIFRIVAIVLLGESLSGIALAEAPTASSIPASDVLPAVTLNQALNEVVGTGQSLAVGHESRPVVSTLRLYPSSALMFNRGTRLVIDDPAHPNLLDGAALEDLVGLVESGTPDDAGEDIGAGLTFGVNDLLGGSYPLLFSEHGLSATPYSGLQKGTVPYRNVLTAVERSVMLASPWPVIVRAVTITHGESDNKIQTSRIGYESDLVQWQHDFDSDIRSITGQSKPVIEFIDQMNGYTDSCCGASPVSEIPLAQLQAAIDHPTTIFLVTPKYHLEYIADGHLTAWSERRLGEYYAKAYRSMIVNGVPWKPLYPTSVSISANRVTVTFNVPVAPLVFDTKLVRDPGNMGFEYSDTSSAPPMIDNVTIVDSDQVQIELSRAPVAAAGNRFLAYAWTGIARRRPGPKTGPRGCLRDSDPTSIRGGPPLYNWCAAFRIPF